MLPPFVEWLGFRIPTDITLTSGGRDAIPVAAICALCRRGNPMTFRRFDATCVCWDCLIDTARNVKRQRTGPRPALPEKPIERTGVGPLVDMSVWGQVG